MADPRLGQNRAPQGFWRDPGAVPTSEAIALEAWARHAHEVLVETAGRYHAVVREAELAEAVQTATGIRSSRPYGRWMTKVLAPLAHLHHRSGEPPLTALVVDAHGWVGERYDDALRAADHLPLADVAAREQHAARARLECYRWAGSAPADGGEPAPVAVAAARAARTPRAAAGRTPGARRTRPAAPARRPRQAASDRPVAVCPSCFMALPATGVCDNCG